MLFIVNGCSVNEDKDIERILKRSKNQAFVDKKFYDKSPLTQIINMPNYSNLSTPLVLKYEQKLKIYAVGETLFSLSDITKKYYLKSDDMELFFAVKDSTFTRKFRFNVSKANDEEYLKSLNIEFKSRIKYPEIITEIKIPFKILYTKIPKDLDKMRFDVTVGDNDDGYMQKSKLAWSRLSDELNENINDYGTLILSKNSHNGSLNNEIISTYGTPKIDGKVDHLWNRISSTRIGRKIYGFIKDSLDLSALVKSTWDEDSIYFLVKVTDLNVHWIYPKDRNSKRIFVDEGWIEDEKGNRVWQMNPFSSSHAGGAFKNQKVDTVVKLKAGKYIVRYVTDESHSFGNWDNEPPQTPFYGIVLYGN